MPGAKAELVLVAHDSPELAERILRSPSARFLSRGTKPRCLQWELESVLFVFLSNSGHRREFQTVLHA